MSIDNTMVSRRDIVSDLDVNDDRDDMEDMVDEKDIDGEFGDVIPD